MNYSKIIYQAIDAIQPGIDMSPEEVIEIRREMRRAAEVLALDPELMGSDAVLPIMLESCEQLRNYYLPKSRVGARANEELFALEHSLLAFEQDRVVGMEPSEEKDGAVRDLFEAKQTLNTGEFPIYIQPEMEDLEDITEGEW